MHIVVYQYSDYKRYLTDLIESFPKNGHGIKRKLAMSISCQSAYVSHVLAGPRDFSLEQGEAAAQFFGLSADEKDYFLNLLEYNKAGTPSLKRYLKDKLDHQKQEYQAIKNRITRKASISKEDQATYYSSWHYQAVYSCLAVPAYRSVEQISKKLCISATRVKYVLQFLIARGMVILNNQEYMMTKKSIHLDNKSPLIGKLHTNWRMHTINEVDDQKADSFHYSGVVTLSQHDFEKVREIYMNALIQSHEVIAPSESEEVCIMAMDFYRL